MKKIFTLADARDEKRAQDLPGLIHAEEQAAIAAVLAANPEIGVLGHGKNRVFYAYVDGYAAPAFTSKNVADVAAKLRAN